MVEHQARMEEVYQQARRRLVTAANRREQRNPGPPEPPLPAGTLVLRRHHPLGRCKIQNRWERQLYRVVKPLDPAGTTYSVCPLGDPGDTRVVHRTELRRWQGTSPLADPVDTRGSSDESDGEVSIRLSPPRRPVVPPSPTSSLADTSLDDLPWVAADSPPDSPAAAPLTPRPRTGTPEVQQCQMPPAPPVASPAPPGNPLPRRSSRTTFGQHSNPFHLPKSTVAPPLPPAPSTTPEHVAGSATFESRGECNRRDNNTEIEQHPQEPSLFPRPPSDGATAPVPSGDLTPPGSTLAPAYINPEATPPLPFTPPNQRPGGEQVATTSAVQRAREGLSGGKRSSCYLPTHRGSLARSWTMHAEKIV